MSNRKYLPYFPPKSDGPLPPKKKVYTTKYVPREEYFANQYHETLFKHYRLQEQLDDMMESKSSIVLLWNAAVEVTRPDQEERL